MPEKLLTLQELSQYLGVSEERIIALVDNKVISAYKIGGELLRFRKEQIEAIRAEIESRLADSDRIQVSEARKNVKERAESSGSAAGEVTLRDRVADFFYFNDFFIVSGALIVLLLVFILRG